MKIQHHLNKKKKEEEKNPDPYIRRSLRLHLIGTRGVHGFPSMMEIKWISFNYGNPNHLNRKKKKKKKKKKEEERIPTPI